MHGPDMKELGADVLSGLEMKGEGLIDINDHLRVERSDRDRDTSRTAETFFYTVSQV